MTRYSTLEVRDRDDGVVCITMARPDKLNAWDATLERELGELFAILEAQISDVRVILLAGAGRAFCAGVDLEVVTAEQALPQSAFRTRMAARHRLFDWIENVEALVVAAIHGHCLGGGLELALACDFRLASENARLGMPELQFGQVPGSGAPSRISYVAGPAVAKDLVITGRTVDAHEAMTLGLVHRVFDESMFDQSVEEFVALLASRPPLAASMAKRVIDTLARRGSAEARAVERLAQSALLDTDDLREGLDAYRERRPPQFTGT